MALIPLIPISLLNGKLVAHLYEDTPLWLVRLHDSDLGEDASSGILKTCAYAVQEWSGELAPEMAEWVRPLRTADSTNIALPSKMDKLSELAGKDLLRIYQEFHRRSAVSAEEKKTSSEASPSAEPASGASSDPLAADPAPTEPS